MFGSLGFQELLLIFVVALIVFGPRKLPEIGRSIGKAMGEFRRATNELKNTLDDEVRLEQAPPPPPPATPRIVSSAAAEPVSPAEESELVSGPER